jgi:hypothetical protein
MGSGEQCSCAGAACVTSASSRRLNTRRQASVQHHTRTCRRCSWLVQRSRLLIRPVCQGVMSPSARPVVPEPSRRDSSTTTRLPGWWCVYGVCLVCACHAVHWRVHALASVRVRTVIVPDNAQRGAVHCSVVHTQRVRRALACTQKHATTQPRTRLGEQVCCGEAADASADHRHVRVRVLLRIRGVREARRGTRRRQAAACKLAVSTSNACTCACTCARAQHMCHQHAVRTWGDAAVCMARPAHQLEAASPAALGMSASAAQCPSRWWPGLCVCVCVGGGGVQCGCVWCAARIVVLEVSQCAHARRAGLPPRIATHSLPHTPARAPPHHLARPSSRAARCACCCP